jgi:hypothetical protein
MADIVQIFTKQVISTETDADEVPYEPGEESEFWAECRTEMLQKIDQLRALVLRGTVREVIFVARDHGTGYFLTELMIPAEHDRNDLFGYAGVLDALKTELADEASMAPYMKLSGEIVDPFEEGEP